MPKHVAAGILNKQIDITQCTVLVFMRRFISVNVTGQPGTRLITECTGVRHSIGKYLLNATSLFVAYGANL